MEARENSEKEKNKDIDLNSTTKSVHSPSNGRTTKANLTRFGGWAFLTNIRRKFTKNKNQIKSVSNDKNLENGQKTMKASDDNQTVITLDAKLNGSYNQTNVRI